MLRAIGDVLKGKKDVCEAAWLFYLVTMLMKTIVEK
jgi:hypothetical protein